MILFSFSTDTTSVMQLGEQEWLMYLSITDEAQGFAHKRKPPAPSSPDGCTRTVCVSVCVCHSFSPGWSSCNCGIDHVVIINPEHVNAAVLHTHQQRNLSLATTKARFHDNAAKGQLILAGNTCDSYSRSFRLATSLLMMVPMYSMTMVHFSMSLAA